MEKRPCENQANCPLAGACREDIHHTYFPKSEYTSYVERTFRSLGSNTVRMCRQEHIELHRTTEPPEKPSLETMLKAIVDEQHPSYTSKRKKKVIQTMLRTVDI